MTLKVLLIHFGGEREYYAPQESERIEMNSQTERASSMEIVTHHVQTTTRAPSQSNHGCHHTRLSRLAAGMQFDCPHRSYRLVYQMSQLTARQTSGNGRKDSKTYRNDMAP